MAWLGSCGCETSQKQEDLRERKEQVERRFDEELGSRQSKRKVGVGGGRKGCSRVFTEQRRQPQTNFSLKPLLSACFWKVL